MTWRHAKLLTGISTAMVTATVAAGGTAAGADVSKTVDGVTAYLGVVPARIIKDHDPQHPESEMHDGAPGGEHAFHVMVALFDTETDRRIEDATVEAEVAPLALAPQRKQLERMLIADTVTYGNYFTMRIREPYEITFSITTPERSESVEIEFTYEHRR